MSQQATVVKMPLSETSKKYLGINIDTKRDELLSEQAKKLVEDYYCKDKETSPQQAYARAAVAYSYGDMDLAQRIYDYVSKGWFMYASPVLSTGISIIPPAPSVITLPEFTIGNLNSWNTVDKSSPTPMSLSPTV